MFIVIRCTPLSYNIGRIHGALDFIRKNGRPTDIQCGDDQCVGVLLVKYMQTKSISTLRFLRHFTPH
jgi:hypothetical protein